MSDKPKREVLTSKPNNDYGSGVSVDIIQYKDRKRIKFDLEAGQRIVRESGADPVEEKQKQLDEAVRLVNEATNSSICTYCRMNKPKINGHQKRCPGALFLAALRTEEGEG